MMRLGQFTFGISTAAYQTLSRSNKYRWAAQELFGRQPTLQYTGPDSSMITLEGVIYPEFRGGLAQIDGMREMAESGAPLLLVAGTGAVAGRVVIESIDEKHSVFAAGGVPRKIDFTISLRSFHDGVVN